LKTRRPQEPAERSAQLFIVIDDGDVHGWCRHIGLGYAL
jgi:hypothetical protein